MNILSRRSSSGVSSHYFINIKYGKFILNGFKPFIYIFIFYMYTLFSYQYLPYHHYIILKIKIECYSLRASISAGCFSSSCTSVPIHRCIKDINIIEDTIRLFISTLKLRGEMASITSWSSSSSST